MGVPKLLELTFLPALDDNPLPSPEYQKGLRSFADALEAEGGVSVEIELMDRPSGGNQATYSGVFTMDGVSVQVNRGIIAWLKDHSGRQVRVGVGPVGRRPTAEAQNCEDVERLLTKAGEYIDIMREISAKDTGSETALGGKMEALQINLLLIPGPDGPPIGDLAYQQGLEQLGQSLNSQGWEVSSLIELRESADGRPTVSGFVITLAPYVSAVLAAALGALGGWLHGRNGRKVKLKFGTAGQLEEVEAQTPEQLKDVMAIAEKYIQRNHPTVIP